MGPAALNLGTHEPELVRHARAHAPREACGFLLGSRRASKLCLEHVLLARNLAGELERFELDPLELLAAHERAETLGLSILGVWHSHPARPAVPSAADRLGNMPGWVMLIVSLEHGAAPELRAWRSEGERIEELALDAR